MIRIWLLAAALAQDPAGDVREVLQKEQQFRQLVQQGNRDFNAGRFGPAARAYEQALTMKDDLELAHREAPTVQQNLGHAYFRQEKWQRAIDAYGQCHAPAVLAFLARCHLALENFDEAHHTLMAHLARNPKDESSRDLLLFLYQSRGEHDLAAAFLREKIRANPADAKLYRQLAAEDLARGETEAGLNSLEIAWRLGLREPDVARTLGDLYLSESLHREAADYYQKYLQVVDEPSAEDHFRVGYNYFLAGERVSATKHLRQAAAMDSRHAIAHVYLADLARREGRDEDVIPEYRAALEKDPNLADAHAGLGQYHLDRQEYAEAAASFARALESGATSAVHHYNLVVSLIEAGDKDVARQRLKEALHVHPDHALLKGLVPQLAR